MADEQQISDHAGDADAGGFADLDSLIDQVAASLDGSDESPGPADSPSSAAASSGDAPDAPPTSPVSPDSPDADISASEDEVNPYLAELEAERAERARIEAHYARLEAEKKARDQQAAWAATWQTGMDYWESVEEQIYEDAESAYNPQETIRQRMKQLNAAKVAWINKFHADYGESERVETLGTKARNYANYLRDEFKFSKTEADHIVAYATRHAREPHLVDAEVRRLIATKTETQAEIARRDQRIKELERQMAAERLSARVPSPGTGRKPAGGQKAKSLDDYLDQVLA